MATSGIIRSVPLAPLIPAAQAARVASSVGADAVPSLVPAAYLAALGQPDPVVSPGIPPRPDSLRRPSTLQARPEYALVMLMAQRPGQLRKLFESLGGAGAEMDVDVAVNDLQTHLASGGTLAQFGAKRDLDPTTLYLLAVQSRIAQRQVKGKASPGLERETDELLAAHEIEIGAALNTSQAMRTLSGSASDRMWMRSLYVAAITVRSPISETFESLLLRFGTSGFEQGASTLLRALSADIAAHRSSVAPDRLQGLLLASLVSMRHVLGLIHSSQAFLRQQGVAAVRSSADLDGRPPGSGHPDGESPSGEDRSASAEPNDAALAGQRLKVEAVTVQLVKLLLQLTAASNAARAVPAFLNQDVGGGMTKTELLQLRSRFIELVRSLPASLWKEATHKDQLVETLRRQFEAEMIQGALPVASPRQGLVMKAMFDNAYAQLGSVAARTGLRRLAGSVRGRPDLLAAGLIMLIVMMMIVPLPKPVVDATIAFNFSVAILLVALVTYIPNPLAFSTFPTLLLMVTAFRLAISISTTRLVLLEADAGRIVEAFGAFVVGGNAVVGLVMFLILTVVQFLVVTKGAERIAEVSARFSLDSLPGKQLSIDSDLRAGFIDAAEARRRRGELARESQLFGAMDGTMKFVKGDAIAGLIIVAINLVGGFAVGMLQHGMTAGESIHRFTVLTVGDGLIAQIPALLIALSCGLLIARVAPEASDADKADGTIGHEISRQLLSEPRAWLFAAVMIVMLGMLPGMPFVLFLGIASVVGLVGIAQVRSVKRKLAGVFTDQQLSDEGRKDLRRIVPNIPLAVRVAARYEKELGFVPVVEHIRKLRNGIVAEYGVTLPSLVFQFYPDIAEDELQVCIHETPQARISFKPGMIAWRMPPGSTTPPPAALIETSVIPRATLREEGWFWTGTEQREGLIEAGLFVQTFETFFDERVRQVLFDHGAQFIGMQEMRAFIGWLDNEAPELAKEIQRTVPLAKLCNLLQQLARERVPVRNFRLIAETLISSGLHDRDPEVIVDFLRQVLRDEITSRYEIDGAVHVCLLHSTLEDELRDSLRQSAVGVYFDIPPGDLDQIHSRIVEKIYPDGA